MKVNRSQIKALAAGDMAYVGVRNGEGHIDMILRSREPGEEDARLEFPTRFTHTLYDRSEQLKDSPTGGFLVYLNPDDSWATFVRSLRPGDEVVPHFAVKNSSPNMKASGFYEDFLEMRVLRDQGEEKPPKKLTFLITNEIGRNCVLPTQPRPTQ